MKVFVLVSALFCVCRAPTSTVRWPYCGNATSLTAPHGLINSHSGLVHGHHYGKSMDCHWSIEAPAGKVVEVWAKTFDVEHTTGCSRDYLELIDGNSTNARSMGKFCGTTFPVVTSTHAYLTLRFVTDARNQQAGFTIGYNFTTTIIKFCSPSMFTCINGNCVTTRNVCDHKDDCGDGSDEQGCVGVTPKRPISGTGHSGGACGVDKFQCANRNCIAKDWLCDGDDDCKDGSDERTSSCHAISALAHPLPTDANGCGELNVNVTTGAISSPNYPNDYANDANCNWTIHAPNGTRNIQFKFAPSFSIEDDVNCAYDFVVIYSDRHSHKHGPFCGGSPPAQFTIPGNHAYADFLSDAGDNFQGFRLDWRANCKYESAMSAFIYIHCIDA